MRGTLLFMLFLLVIQGGYGQTPASFANFAQKQDSLFQQAYQRKDTVEFNHLLAEFSKRYSGLKLNDQRAFRPYLFNACYNLACTYALLNEKSKALYWLKRSIDAGYADYHHIQEDHDLSSLRAERKFKNLVRPLRAIGDYSYILKKGSVYDSNDHRPLPAFTYQSASDSNLRVLRSLFHLDSIAGAEDDISRVLNLMHWIHNLIPHDGNHENPPIRNAIQLINICKNENRGLNCRGLATVLNECYLSMGYASRIVTCLPKDSLHSDPDCHVINMVWIPQLQKWIWIDPTFDTWVADENGNLLSIEEVRERLIQGRPLCISPEANWNHKIRETPSYYLGYYMSKNLYRLECPAASTFDLETKIPGKVIRYIDLIPLDDYPKTRQPNTVNNPANRTSLIFYQTTNPQTFWQKPQQAL